MTLNDVSHDLLPSIAWDYYMKKIGSLFCYTSPTDNGKSTGILPVCAMILPQFPLIESMV